MAVTLAQASLLTNSMLIRGVIETVVSESAVLNYLPFMEVIGSSLAFPQETALPSVAFNAVGGAWAESAPTFNQTTETLKILGGDADVDNYLERSFTQENDIQAVILHEKAKAVAYQFNASFFSGDTGVDANSFDGIDKRIGAAAAAQTITAGANGAALTLPLMDQLIDAVKPGRPDVLFMSRRSRRTSISCGAAPAISSSPTSTSLVGWSSTTTASPSRSTTTSRTVKRSARRATSARRSTPSSSAGTSA
jgi:HK97 family phage major capsid protein